MGSEMCIRDRSWVEAKRRLTAIEKLRSQRHKEQQAVNEKREQRVLDDLFVVQQLFDLNTVSGTCEV